MLAYCNNVSSVGVGQICSDPRLQQLANKGQAPTASSNNSQLLQNGSQFNPSSTETHNSNSSTTHPLPFAPCPSAEITVPSFCLGNFLPDPKDIGSDWASGGPSIPSEANPNPMITQYVHDDFENLHANPKEVFDVWIEEWESADQAHSAFKSDERLSSGATHFVGNPESNDITFVYIVGQGNGQSTYYDEFVIGTVIVKVEGTGGSTQSAISDLGIIAKIIVNNMQNHLHP